MKLKILEIHSKEMFPGLMLGKPKDGMYEKSLTKIIKLFGIETPDISDIPNINNVPVFNLSGVKWEDIYDNGKYSGYGTWGHITGTEIEISDKYDIYSFIMIFNYYPEKEKLEDKVSQVINEIDWENKSFKWSIGDW